MALQIIIQELLRKNQELYLGKTYTFKVETYTNEEPKDQSLIKWAVSYTDSETSQYYKNTLEDVVTGDTLNITFKNQNMCGNNLEVKAYINDIENEGKLPLFKHNRFRFFDREIIKKDIIKRKVDPWLINQDDTNTCGPSAIMYAFAKKDKESYSQFILDLHRKGYAKHNNYSIDISSDGDLEDTNPTTKNNYPTSMASCDWIPNICITDQENSLFDYEGDTKEDFSAITLPSRLENQVGLGGLL